MPEVNDGHGLYDTQGMFNKTLDMMDILADAKGVFRAKVLSSIYDMVKALRDGVKKELVFNIKTGQIIKDGEVR